VISVFFFCFLSFYDAKLRMLCRGHGWSRYVFVMSYFDKCSDIFQHSVIYTTVTKRQMTLDMQLPLC